MSAGRQGSNPCGSGTPGPYSQEVLVPSATKTGRDYEVFCHMIFEEFLMKKNLHATLAQFRSEWDRPSDEVGMLSWYETALKLRLPELAQQGGGGDTVIENLVTALLREASMKSRRAPEVLVAGLAALPRPRNLPAMAAEAQRAGSAGARSGASGSGSLMQREDEVLASAGSVQSASVSKSLGGSRASHAQDRAQSPAAAAVTKKLSKKVALGQSTVHLNDESALIVRRQLEEMQGEKALQARAKGYVKPSAENWVPELTRMRSLERDLHVAKDNLADIQAREAMEHNEMKQFRVSALDKAIKAESLGKMHRLACGCCLLVFLPINLPLKVSQKAVLDIRIKWSGSLDSETVFGQQRTGQGEEAAAGSNPNPNPNREEAAAGSPEGKSAGEADGENDEGRVAAKSKAQSYLEKMAERLSVVPRCYDEVSVCTFCAQFFQDSEQYRPSYDKIYYDERKAAHLKAKEKERLYWDPLQLVERDRELEELASPSAPARAASRSRPASNG